MLTDITNGVQTVSATGGLAAASVSTIPVQRDWTLFAQIVSLTAGKKAHIQVEASLDGFSTAQALLEVDISGPVLPVSDIVHSVRKYELAGNDYIGIANAQARVRVVSIDAAGTLAVRAWLETF
jgi:hypothetical protein